MSKTTLAFVLAVVALALPAAAQSPKALDPAAIDATANPCGDFYQYADGGWIKTNPMPADKARWGSFEELADRNRAVLKAILEETSAKTDWPKGSNRQKVGDFYAAGMNEAAIEKAGIAPLKPWLAKVDALKSSSELPAILATLYQSRLGSGFSFFVGQDQKNSTRYIPMIGQGGLGLPDRDYYLKEDAKSKEIREKYVAHVAKMLGLAGEPAEQAKADANTVMTFETALAKASRTRVELRDPIKNYNLTTLASLEKDAPGFGWRSYLGLLHVSPAQELNLRQPEFAKSFAAIAEKTSIADWKTYLRWHVVRAASPFLTKAFVDEDFAFDRKTLEGVEQQEERWKRVVAATDRAIGEALGQLYVERTFSPKAKERMKVLVENERAALKERIEALPWMGAETKAAALKKLAAFNVKIGYPDKWRDYSKLDIDRTSFLANVLRAHTFEVNRNLAKLGKSIDRTEWGMTPPTVNAYYSPTMNEIVFPAGILQPPFFYADADDAVNYGGIGVVIGHEMSHGFDDSGSKYDFEGNMKNWWTDADRKAYEERTALMVKQFDGYQALPDQTINGKLTLGENIGDLGGLKIAWAALTKALGKDPNAAENIDGQTPGQRFFLSHATVWRGSIRDEALRVRLNTDPHSPGRWRVIGPLSNLSEFHQAFGCAVGTAMMRPEAERPTIW